MQTLLTYIKRFRYQIIIFFSVIFGIIGALNIYFAIEVNPMSNDQCLWNPEKIAKDSSALVLREILPGGVTDQAGLKDGDILVALNGKRFKTAFEAQRIINAMEPGQYAVYSVYRDGELLEKRVLIQKLINVTDLSTHIYAFIWLLIGIIVLLAKPDGIIQKLFYLIGICLVITSSIELAVPRYSEMAPSLIGNIYFVIWQLSGALMPVFFMHFFFIFPHRFAFTRKKSVMIILYGIGAVAFALGIYQLFFQAKIITIFMIVLGAGTLNRLFYFFSSIVALIALIIGYTKIKDKRKKRPIFFILISYILGLLSILYVAFVAPQLGGLIFLAPEFYLPIVLIMLLPVSFGYAIFRYQLMDVSMIIRNTVTYGTATITLAVIYLLSMYGLGQSIGRAIGTEYQGLIAAVTFVLFALLFQSTKDYFQDLLTKKFYPEQYFYQQALSNFNQELANIVGLDNIFDSIHHTFVNELKVERFALFLKRNTGGCRAVRCHKLQVDRLVLTRNPETLDDYVDTLRTNKSRLYIDQQHFIEAFPDNAETFIEQQIYTIVPLVIKTRVIGFIALGLKHSGTQFGGQDLDLLTSVASQAAISIENARLYEAEAEKIKLEHDLEVARQIQQSLLPVELPSANGIDIYGEMIPAMRIGGDYYDIIPVDENRFYTLVGDVSGKGLSAALYMTKLQTMLRLFCKSGDSPDVILKEINKKLYEQMNRGWFITISLALIDRKNKTISFSRAGHMPTLLFEGSSIREYKSRGMALGLDKGPIFDRTISVETVSLKPGQIFFFYSDGVNETMNEKEELFGEERIQQILITHHKKTPKEITASLWESLRNFQLDYEQHDDITTVIIKVN